MQFSLFGNEPAVIQKNQQQAKNLDTLTAPFMGDQGEIRTDQPTKAASYMRDILASDGRNTGAFWMCKSAMHKEIRRNNANRAFSYARLFKHMTNNSTVKKYLHMIAFEETRNLDYIDFVGDHVVGREFDWVAILSKMVSSIKKWEIPALADTERRLVYARLKNPLSLTAHEVKQYGRSCETLDEAYHILSSIRTSEEYQFIFGRELFERLQIPEQEVLSKWLHRGAYEFNTIQSLADFVFVPESIDQGVSYPHVANYDADMLDFYGFPDYVMDQHVRIGSARMKKGRTQWLSYEQPTGVDIRWSGNQMGNTWRYLAAHSGNPDWQQIPWMDAFNGDTELYQAMLIVQSRVTPDLMPTLNEMDSAGFDLKRMLEC